MSTLTINEGYHAPTGITEKTHFEDGNIIVEKVFDAAPILDYAKRLREANEGKSWGEGKVVGTIPLAVRAEIAKIPDPFERHKRIKAWLRENTAFVTFEKFLK